MVDETKLLSTSCFLDPMLGVLTFNVRNRHHLVHKVLGLDVPWQYGLKNRLPLESRSYVVPTWQQSTPVPTVTSSLLGCIHYLNLCGPYLKRRTISVEKSFKILFYGLKGKKTGWRSRPGVGNLFRKGLDSTFWAILSLLQLLNYATVESNRR